MNLRKQLSKARMIVKIGTINGGGWIFVGKPKEMLEHATEYDVLLKKMMKKSSYVRSDAAKWFKKYKKDCLPLLDREVRESYMSDPIVDIAQCIIIDGNEIGGYWMVSEAVESPISFKGFSQRLDYGQI